jgi:YVTN family beta-propeller protein
MFRPLLAVVASAAAFAGEPRFVAIEKISGHAGFFDAAGTCVKEVKVGAHPHEMAFSADGRYVYVTDNGVLWMTEAGPGGNTVSIVDPRARQVLRRLPTGGEAPHMVLLDGAGRRAYVSNTNTGTIGVVDLESGAVKTIAVGPRPQGAALSPDFGRLYVANSGGESISVIDTEKQELTAEIRCGKAPVRLAVTPDGSTLVYALQAGQAVGFASTRTLKEDKQAPLSGQPVSLTLSLDGRTAYSSVQAQDRIFVISVAGRKVECIIEAPKGSGPDPFLPLR